MTTTICLSRGIFADYVVIMGYDEHNSSSEEAGSVASIGYTELGITRALEAWRLGI